MSVWPGRRLALALLIPALLSLGLFVTAAIGPAVLALDAAIAVVALIDLATLVGSGRFRADRACGRVASLGEPQTVELTIENLGRVGRRLRVRDDVPEAFAAEPGEFEVVVPAVEPFAAALHGRPTASRDVRVRARHPRSSRAGSGSGVRSVQWPSRTEVRVYPDVRQIARYTVLARRDRLSTLGVRRSRRLGTDNEFERLRDYMEGDEPRHMDWRATARRQKLTVRAHQIEPEPEAPLPDRHRPDDGRRHRRRASPRSTTP